jgi:hypothetical protein
MGSKPQSHIMKFPSMFRTCVSNCFLVHTWTHSLPPNPSTLNQRLLRLSQPSDCGENPIASQFERRFCIGTIFYRGSIGAEGADRTTCDIQFSSCTFCQVTIFSPVLRSSELGLNLMNPSPDLWGELYLQRAIRSRSVCEVSDRPFERRHRASHPI